MDITIQNFDLILYHSVAAAVINCSSFDMVIIFGEYNMSPLIKVQND